MSIEQVSNAVAFYAFYSADGVGKTGLTVTVDVYRGATALVTAASATEIGGGLYSYTLASGSTGTEGEYIALFKTTDTTVDTRHLPALWSVGRGGVEYLGTASVTATSPVAVGGDVTIRQGNEYSLSWTLTSPPGTTPTSVTFSCAALAFTKACTYSAPTITLALTEAETAAFGRGKYGFEIEAVIATATSTLVSATILVERDT